ncbi:MAG: transcriptional repressor [Bacteroidaceae bacterium]|nr:transcriptional repressor [Bacteroidaceae bacterium]
MDKYPQAEKVLIEYLTAKKLRRTPERFHLLRVVYGIDKHFTADELYEQMRGVFRVSRATVYSNLDLFVQIGLVSKFLVINSVRYEKCLGMKPHYHMICTKCGEIKEFEDSKISSAIELARCPRFIRHSYSLSVLGFCYKCQAKANRAKRKQQSEDESLQNKRKTTKNDKG